MAGELPTVAVLIPDATRDRVLALQALQALAEFAAVRMPADTEIAPEELPALIDGAVACLTGWGTPPLSDELLATHRSLGLIAHTAGSIRRLVPLDRVARGLRVSHAASIIADAVAEFVISQALLGLRPLHELDRGMKSGEAWSSLRERHLGRLLGACTVGVIGAGYVGRKVIRLFSAFGARVLIADPLLSAAEATALDAELRSVDDLLAASDVVSLHAPVLPETRGMIGAAQLAHLRDGALFINTARAALVDEAALLAELQSGRMRAALDVFESEPLPFDSPFCQLPNVIISPHAAGHSSDTYRRQGSAMVDEVHRFLLNQPLRYEVTAPMLATMA